jgi:hypothetical protein
LKLLVAEGSLTHFVWAANGIATAFGAAAWVVGDVINGAAKAKQETRSRVETGSYAA